MGTPEEMLPLESLDITNRIWDANQAYPYVEVQHVGIKGEQLRLQLSFQENANPLYAGVVRVSNIGFTDGESTFNFLGTLSRQAEDFYKIAILAGQVNESGAPRPVFIDPRTGLMRESSSTSADMDFLPETVMSGRAVLLTTTRFGAARSNEIVLWPSEIVVSDKPFE